MSGNGLSEVSAGLSKDVLDMIKEEVRRVIADKLARMIDGLADSSGLETSNGGISTWVETLEEDQETIAELFFEARDVFNITVNQSQLQVKPLVKGSSKNLKLPPASQQAIVDVKLEDMDSMAKTLLHNVEPLKSQIAEMISQMVAKARRTGLSTPSHHGSVHSGDDGQQPYRQKFLNPRQEG